MHEHKYLSSFLFFRFQSFFKLRERERQRQRQRERERERERVYKIGYKEKQSQGYLSYLDRFLWRIFPLLRATRLYAIFNTGLKKMAPSCPLLLFYFRWREGVPTSVLGSQPIVWLLPSSFPCQATRVRSPSINICGSPLCDLHSFFTVILRWLATANSNKRIVVIIFLSSQWDTTWQLLEIEMFLTNILCTYI